jgi:hypothetical protein
MLNQTKIDDQAHDQLFLSTIFCYSLAAARFDTPISGLVVKCPTTMPLLLAVMGKEKKLAYAGHLLACYFIFKNTNLRYNKNCFLHGES